MNRINKATKIIFLILLCNVALSTHLFSQNTYKRKISISEWVKEMEKCKDEAYELEDTEIFYDATQDSLYAPMLSRYTKPTDKDKKSVKTILPTIAIKNCKLPNNKTCQVRNLIFQNNITFYYCEGASQLIFYNCTFKQGLDFMHSNLGTIEFSYCSILQRTVVLELQISVLLFSNCSLYTDHRIIQKRYGFEEENQTYQFLFRISQNEKKINSFALYNCKILPTEVMPILYFKGGKYDVIHFQGIDFSNSILDFTACSVKENLTVRNCKFKQPFGMHQFNLPKDNTSFNWCQIDSVGLGLYRNYEQAPLTHKTDTLISNIYYFNELNNSYRKFYSMYRTQGDMESANACYKQLKDMETAKYHHLYQLDRSTNKWFNWRFNQFLKYFSEYGTNPVQSLIISMWVILIFAAVYFFFYSDWDGINRAFLIKKHRTIMQYFSSEQRLEDFYTENYIEEFKTFAEYKKEMKENKALVPLFIVLLGKPLYLFSVIKYKLVSFIYRRTELLQGRWIDLKSARKVFVGLTVVISVLIYLIYLGIIRALNSITLSINSFSTLGFGAIPVKGASRYITIIEGFLGWFLLSIFSVSLISQMIQN
ncbi:hypothetical protein EV201_0912 [Ancylomarina subtilis]|uniref:Ion channel n=1 Tax=Ancylomarina subtilis TaxID=1639035 RepID=A0A4Q7VJA9_9BACT|nr:potassium channel family protein [Ancylomarina subtilis]RZT96276.1 hypothetical protein EV201_0912 [Ancylomarina subtilis]